MTTEGWPDVMREVMEGHPSAWIFFVVFILVVTFTMVNLIIAVIVDGIQNATEGEIQAEGGSITELHREMQALTREVQALRAKLDQT